MAEDFGQLLGAHECRFVSQEVVYDFTCKADKPDLRYLTNDAPIDWAALSSKHPLREVEKVILVTRKMFVER